MNSREDIRGFILAIENKFPVNDWKFNDIHIWPVIRLELFLYIRKELYSEKKNKPLQSIIAHQNISFIKRIKAYFIILKKAVSYLTFIKGLEHKRFIFVGNSSFRVNYNGEFFNRFFDVLINEADLKKISYLLENNIKNKELIANKEIIIDSGVELDNFNSFQMVKNKLFKPSEIDFQLDTYDDFIGFLNQHEVTKGFSQIFSTSNLKGSILPAYEIKIVFYKTLLKRIKPDKIFVLCFYGNFELIAAANMLGIETIEMQHGAISKAHMAYDSWTSIPETGYDFLPKKYWCWNESSKALIDLWTGSNKIYSAFVGGNTWVDYWKQIKIDYSYDNFILYTLQPDSLTIQQLFSPQIINAIKLNKDKWYIRIHPRQFDKRLEIENFLEQNEVLDLVNMEEATKDPLPLLLMHCLLHITNSSASAIEASLFGKKTILIHEIGKLYYDSLIKEGSAVFLALDDKFSANLNELIDKASSMNKNESLRQTKNYLAYFK